MSLTAAELITTGTCPHNCTYCYIPKTEYMKKMHEDLVTHLQNGTYIELLKKVYGGDLECLGLWGTEPTLTLPLVADLLPALLNTFPKLKEISFSTAMMADPSIIVGFVKALAETKATLKLKVQMSLDGPGWITDQNRMPGASTLIPRNFHETVRQLNDCDLQRLAVEFKWKATHSLENMRAFIDHPEKVHEYVGYFESIQWRFNKINKNKTVVLKANSYLPSLMVPGKYTSEDGKTFARYLATFHGAGFETIYVNRLEKIFKDERELENRHQFSCSGGDSNLGVGPDRVHICLTPDSMVFGSSPMPIDLIKPGYTVLNEIGSVSKVTTTFEREYVGPIYYVKVRGIKAGLTPNHELFSIKHKLCTVPSQLKKRLFCRPNCKLACSTKPVFEPVWKNVEALQTDDWLVIPKPFLPLSPHQVNLPFTTRGRISKLPSEVTISDTLLELLGWYIAEGFFSKKSRTIILSLNKTEQKEAIWIKQAIVSIFNLSTNIRETETALEVRCYSRNLIDFFERLCGWGAKQKHLPDFWTDLNRQQRESLLRGIFLGDGCVIHRKVGRKTELTRSCITTISRTLALQIIELLLSLGKVPLLATTPSHKDRILGRECNAQECYNVEWAEKSAHPYFYSDSKYFYARCRIDKKEYSGKVYNLETDSNTFCIPFIAHNCHRTFYLDDERYIRSVLNQESSIGDAENWDVSLFRRGTIDFVRDKYIVPPSDLTRFRYVLRGYHDFWRLQLGCIRAMMMELALAGQVDPVWLEDEELGTLFGLFVSTALSCPMENLLNTGSIHLQTVSLLRLFGNGAFQEILKEIQR